MEKTIDIKRQVIERCLQGDIKAQFQLYKQYSKAMYNIAIRFLDNKMDAEDILQESFCTAFIRLNELEQHAAFGGWLKRIVINNCISLQRKRKIRFEEFEADHPGHSADGPEEEFPLIFLEPALVHQAIKKLPAGGRTILIMHALEGYKHKEIAEALNISESTSKTQFSRALSLLRKELKGKAHEVRT